ncbi:MAG TPA: Rieske 2Fe-2S domain-containing protein [Candidatus Acidoferrales bacterium]|nr:Rieske 2Fe-2S domain-containing protein [Candidatus Acidoferrales bacterium]
MSQTYTREELEKLSYDELKKLASELELEGAKIKGVRRLFVDEFWNRIGERPIKLQELGEGKMTAVKTRDQYILFVRVDGKVYAFNNRCPHKGFPLHKGSLQGHTLTCAYHGGKFDVRSGACLKHPYDTHPCKPFNVTVLDDGTVECA